jgi:replicative DNA helicase
MVTIDRENGQGIFDEDRDTTLPPHSTQAEEAVIGSLLKNPSSVRLVIDGVVERDFYLPRNRAVWKAATKLEADGTPIDYHTLTDMLERQGSVEPNGWLVYLSGVGLSTPTAAHIVHYAKIVVRKALQRVIISQAQHWAEAAWRDDKEPEALIDEMIRRMAKLTARASEDVGEDVGSIAERSKARLLEERDRFRAHDPSKGEYMVGWKTGLDGLDRVLLGMKPGDLIYLAARTSVGKSILAQQIAMNVANHGGAVYFVSLEMSKEKLMHRAVTMRTGVLRHEMERGNVTDADLQRAAEAHDIIGSLTMRFDTTARTVETIRRRAIRWRDEIGQAPALIVVDYVQLLRDQAGPRANRYESVSMASHGLKEMAEALGTTVLAPAQVSRQVMNRTSKMPDLSDLRESGDLEQDCDLALGLDRANYHDRNTDDLTATLAVLKARDLASGRGRGTHIPLAWLPSHERYGDLLTDNNVVPFRARHQILPDDMPAPPPDDQGDLPF